MIPLYGRKMCSKLYPALYQDEMATRLTDAVDYDFSALEKKAGSMMQRFGFLEAAMRQNDLAFEVRAYLKAHPKAAVVNLGCGLDHTGRDCANGSCKIYNLDLPDVIRVRDELLPAGEREENIPCDLNDTAWFEKIDASGGAVFFAAGVFYYFLKENVRSLVCAMADARLDSRILLKEAMKRLTARGLSIEYADMTIIAQTPKMAPYIEAMRREIAGCTETPVERINVKATTEEHMGFTGRKEGIRAHAVCLLREP